MPRVGGFDGSSEVHCDAYDAGHILGSTSLALTITENGKKTIVVFSGDIGRYGEVILNDPTTPPKADILLCESTYGDRDHEDGDPAALLAEIVNCVVKSCGAIRKPAFAIGRPDTSIDDVRQLDGAD